MFQNDVYEKKDVIFDIETLTLSPLEEGARVVAIGFKRGDYSEVLVSTSEKTLLQKFWNLPFFSGYYRLVGFNSFGFDLPYLLIRSFKYGIKVPDFKGKSIDLRFVLSYGNKFQEGKLEDYSKLLLGKEGKKLGNGENVEKLWNNKKFGELKGYCMRDIFLTYKIYERLRHMGVL